MQGKVALLALAFDILVGDWLRGRVRSEERMLVCLMGGDGRRRDGRKRGADVVY
jgi:hypothetical protein